MQLQKDISGFCMLTAAADVDDEMDPEGHGDSLCTRLESWPKPTWNSSDWTPSISTGNWAATCCRTSWGEGAMGSSTGLSMTFSSDPAAIKVLRTTSITQLRWLNLKRKFS